jgi:hypothetical protein
MAEVKIPKNIPQGLKPRDSRGLCGTTKVVPFQKAIYEIASSIFSPLPLYPPDFLSILAQASFSGRVRLKTSFPAVESGSRQK